MMKNKEKCERNLRRKRWICWNRQSEQFSVCWAHLCMRVRVRFKCNPVCFPQPGLILCWIQYEFCRLF
jgi:hypothetical protein